MSVWDALGGMLEAELTSAEPEAAIAAFSSAGIELRNLQKSSELTYGFSVRRADRKKLEALCEHRGAYIRFRIRPGLYWVFRCALKRPVLLFGCVALLLITYWLPSRVLFVRVEGNVQVPERQILAAAEECGIAFGSSAREVRSEKMKNALLSAIPQLQWAGVNTSGCHAVISVREKRDTDPEEQPEIPATITAVRDGYVLQATAEKGALLVRPGDTVKTGQVLISAYTDCGFCVRAEHAEGEILAQTQRELEAVMQSEGLRKPEKMEVRRKYSLLLRKKRIFLWEDSGICGDSCGRMYEEYYITLPGGFRLPAAVCVEHIFFGDTTLQEWPDTETELDKAADNWITRQMVGGKILRADQTVIPENGVYRLRGTYSCMEMIGRLRQEQIGDTNGKND